MSEENNKNAAAQDGAQTAVVDAAATPAPDKADTAAAANPAAGTGKDAVGAEKTTTEVPFPDDWRQKMAGDDVKLLKKLERYPSPKAFADEYKKLNDKVLGGEFRKVLGKDATPEEVAQWRKENGVPEKAEAYYDALGKDVSIPEEHKPVFDAFFEKIHPSNLSADQTKAVVSTYYELLENQKQQRQEADAAHLDKSTVALRQEWGGEFTKNMTIVDSFLKTIPTSVADSLIGGRGADGVLLKHNPEVVRWLSQLAYEANPAANLVPSTHSRPIEGIKERMAEIEKIIGSRDKNIQNQYYKNPDMQAEYSRLTDALVKMKK